MHHIHQTSWRVFLKLNKIQKTIAKGSSLKLCVIAEGNADIYPRLAPTMEWDIAAGHCILEEAGGYLSTYPEKKEFCYNKETLINESFVASNYPDWISP